jgi:hypothetical protein
MAESQQHRLMVYEKQGQFAVRKIAGETLLVPIRGKLADMQQIFALNEVAELIWEKIDGKTALSEIRDSVVEAFDVLPSQADQDIEEFIDELTKTNLIILKAG